MVKRLILHDLPPQMAEELCTYAKDATVFCARPVVRHCVGCFGCWIKTPGQCVIADRAREFCAAISRHDELIIISKLTFGGLSPDVKAVLDRSIGYMLPFFRIVGGEMHHVQRFPSSPSLTYHFYQTAGKTAQKQTAQKLAAANAINFGSPNVTVCFYEDNPPIGEALL
ncbi:MAG: flavodoxin family protein [Clostridiaceae bacterium]|nr:flavodoxin family protein [Eubacteriales bacterium]